MGEAYRRLWTKTEGHVPTNKWAKHLLKIGQERADKAYQQWLETGNDYPPTLGQLIAVTKAMPACHKPLPALPKPKRDMQLIDGELAKIRAKLGARAAHN